MHQKIKWGIIGLGKIANKFAEDLLLSKDSILYGVASREIEKAKKFGDRFNAIKYYGSYEELAQDKEIDVVYIATPHVFHFENTLMCLKNNKAVLCEKPMGMNAEEVEIMINEAQSRNLFLMEGLWTRFIPATEKALEILNKKTIGDLSFIRADFGFNAEADPEGRLYNKKLGGGSLLDIGIYPIYLSLLTFGFPEKVKAMAEFTETEVDGHCSMLLSYPKGIKAHLESTIEMKTPTEAYIFGSNGVLKFYSPFHHTEKIALSVDGKIKTWSLKYKGNGYFYEIEEVNKCLRNRKTESSKLPLTTSKELITIIDRVRKEIGLTYKS